MVLEIIDIFAIGEKYAITLNGDFAKVKNGTMLTSEDGKAFSVQSVAMVNRIPVAQNTEITILSSTKPPPIGTKVNYE